MKQQQHAQNERTQTFTNTIYEIRCNVDEKFSDIVDRVNTISSISMLNKLPVALTLPPFREVQAAVTNIVNASREQAVAAAREAGELMREAVEDTVDDLTDLIPEEAGALFSTLEPLVGLWRDFVKGKMARAETHRVREVVAFSSMIFMHAVQSLDDDDDGLSLEIEATLMRRRVFEPRGTVRRILESSDLSREMFEFSCIVPADAPVSSLEQFNEVQKHNLALQTKMGDMQKQNEDMQTKMGDMQKQNADMQVKLTRMITLLEKGNSGAPPAVEQANGVGDGSSSAKFAFEASKDGIQRELDARFLALEEMEARATEMADDPLAKQLALTECLRLRKELVAACSRVQDIGQALGVVVRFLSGMTGKLDTMNGKLDSLQSQISVLHEEMRRLTHRPVLEEFKERRDKLLRRHHKLRDKVHVPIEGVHSGGNGRFEVSESNTAFDLMHEVDETFLKRSGAAQRVKGDTHLQPTVLLLSGPAGSGKVRSTTANATAMFHVDRKMTRSVAVHLRG